MAMKMTKIHIIMYIWHDTCQKIVFRHLRCKLDIPLQWKLSWVCQARMLPACQTKAYSKYMNINQHV